MGFIVILLAIPAMFVGAVIFLALTEGYEKNKTKITLIVIALVCSVGGPLLQFLRSFYYHGKMLNDSLQDMYASAVPLMLLFFFILIGYAIFLRTRRV